MEISCSGLWKDMLDVDSDHPVVTGMKNRISKYSRDDWKFMASEAVTLTETLAELVRYKIPVNTHLALAVFYEFKHHFDKWFYTMDHETFVLFAIHCKFDKNCNAFFNQFEPGLGDYLLKLIYAHVDKIENK